MTFSAVAAAETIDLYQREVDSHAELKHLRVTLARDLQLLGCVSLKIIGDEYTVFYNDDEGIRRFFIYAPTQFSS